MEILASTASIFAQILALKQQNFSSPDPLSEAKISLQALHFGNPGQTPLPEKKLSAPLWDFATKNTPTCPMRPGQ